MNTNNNLTQCTNDNMLLGLTGLLQPANVTASGGYYVGITCKCQWLARTAVETATHVNKDITAYSMLGYKQQIL